MSSVILGIDPGTAIMGYGVLKFFPYRRTIKCLEYGVIRTSPHVNQGERLRIIHNNLLEIIKKHKPEITAIESLYFFKNLKTIIPVSQAGGMVLFVAAKKRIPLFHFTPLEIKLTITGKGRAEKKEIQKGIKKMLHLKEIPQPDDAADALAVALTYIRKVLTKK